MAARLRSGLAEVGGEGVDLASCLLDEPNHPFDARDLPRLPDLEAPQKTREERFGVVVPRGLRINVPDLRRPDLDEARGLQVPDGAHDLLPRPPQGAGVRARRGELGLSQEEFAFRAGLHPTYVSGVERGRRNVSLVNIGGLATALSLKPSELMERCGM